MRPRRLGIVSPTWTWKLRTRTFVAAQAVGAAFAARLHELGRIRRGELDSTAWRAECESVGLADVRLV